MSKEIYEMDEKQYAYIKYLYKWYNDHFGSEYQGMEPACYEEFLTNEYIEGAF